MYRNLLALLSVAVVLSFAASARGAQSEYGGEGGGESLEHCLCKQILVGAGTKTKPEEGPTCMGPAEACGDTECTTNDDCEAGQLCGDKAYTQCDDCGIYSPCVGGFCSGAGSSTACTGTKRNECRWRDNECKPGLCDESSSVENGAVQCSRPAPTLSQWGLIVFGMLLLTMMYLTIRRRGLPTQMTASLLVLGAVGLAVATAAYAQIQSERTCRESDIAIEFVNDLLDT